MPPRHRQLSEDLILSGPGRKRILTLDGGGLRGILMLGSGISRPLSSDSGSATATILTT
jgi:hypothetical protein